MSVIQILPSGNIYHPTFSVVFDTITKQVLKKCKTRIKAQKWVNNLTNGLV